MFQALVDLVRAAGKLNLSLKMEGDDMVVFVVPAGDSKATGLQQPLVLSGTPDSLDAEFAQAIASYSGVRRSLSEQVQATTAIMEVAKGDSANKAQKALAGKGKTGTVATASAGDDDDDGDSDGDSETATPTSSPPAPAVAAPSGTDLSSLLL